MREPNVLFTAKLEEPQPGPDDLQNILAHSKQPAEEISKLFPVVLESLTPENYGEKQHLLLFMEEFERSSWRKITLRRSSISSRCNIQVLYQYVYTCTCVWIPSASSNETNFCIDYSCIIFLPFSCFKYGKGKIPFFLAVTVRKRVTEASSEHVYGQMAFGIRSKSYTIDGEERRSVPVFLSKCVHRWQNHSGKFTSPLIDSSHMSSCHSSLLYALRRRMIWGYS